MNLQNGFNTPSKRLLMYTPQKLALGLLNLTLIGAASADWTLIDDFEGDPNDPAYSFVVTLGSRSTPEFRYEDDPELGEANTAFFCDPVSYGTEWTNVYLNWTLPEAIPDGAVGTFFFRFYIEATDGTGMLPIPGMTDVPYLFDENLQEPTQPSGFGAYEPATIVGGTNLQVRDAGAYVVTEKLLTPQVWYKLWAVVDNENDWATYYIQGPDDSTPQHVLVPGTGGPFDNALFRNGTTDPLVGFMYAVNAGDPLAPRSGIPTWMDDIYYDASSANLEDPTTDSASFGPGDLSDYEVDSQGWLFAGNAETDAKWFGWVNVTHYPWVYVLDVQKYVYFASGTNGWTYSPKP